jgi:hypothetical protein
MMILNDRQHGMLIAILCASPAACNAAVNAAAGNWDFVE